MSSKPFDLIVFGASSFVGQILCNYLLEQNASQDFSWAIAGRSASKLDDLKRSLGDAASGLDVVIADAGDEQAMLNLCEQASVVVSTVGPYALYGEPLVKACAESGTDYCDLTGEVHWIRRMLDRYEASAKQTGARIVHCCGFDSIPSDLGVHFLQNLAEQELGSPCASVKMRVQKLKGGASGGTIASMINLSKEAAKDPALRKELANPYSICPQDHGFSARQHNVKAEYDEAVSSWLAPFVMASINTRVVHRSNALSGNRYGQQFLYEEAMMTGDGSRGKRRAKMAGLGLGAFMLATALPPSRWLLQRFVLPEPGEGPSPEEQLNGRFDLRFIGEHSDGGRVQCKVTGDRDPGYGSTAKMLGQAACCLAFDLEGKPGGFWTPATLMGDALIARLEQHSGLTFEHLRGITA